MTLEPFHRDDIPTFLAMAAAEGWVAEAWEFDFTLAMFPEGCLCMRDASGTGCGFVTSISHGCSGWIGNLIVAQDFRNRGLGEKLFRGALSALQSAGVSTFWLTASKDGRALYERHGFTSLDTIFRWTGSGRQRRSDQAGQPTPADVPPSAAGIDCLAWGGRRDVLLKAVADRGRLLVEETGFMVIQPCGGALQLGPFAALDSSTAGRIFSEALASVPGDTKVYIDAPASNRTAGRLFKRSAMQVHGSTELMYAGKKPAYAPELLYGLASMGSMG